MNQPWPTPNLLPIGITLLRGVRHTGKSWLVLNPAMAVTRGNRALGSFLVEHGNVLYIALEYVDTDSQQAISERSVALPDVV